MTLAYSILRRPDKVTFHEVRDRGTDNKGRERRSRVTWCGIPLSGGWKVQEMEREATCERCAWVKRMADEHREAA